MTNNILIRTAALALVVSIAGCVTSAPEPQAPALPKVAPEQRLAAVEAAAGQDDKELAVQPLRDPQVEDLRQAADRALASRDYAAAAEALNQALLIVADDPAVLQERAEVALLQSDFERAETLAKRAYDLGSQVGPLCRRHWATIEQSRLGRGETDNAASAQAQIAVCTVPGINRM
jgi:Flp pilus assembly protein TadD